VLQSVGQVTLPFLISFGVTVVGVVGVVVVGVLVVGVVPVGVALGVGVGVVLGVLGVGVVVLPPVSSFLAQPAITTAATRIVRIGSRRIRRAAPIGG